MLFFWTIHHDITGINYILKYIQIGNSYFKWEYYFTILLF